jgi:hypothetical protein
VQEVQLTLSEACDVLSPPVSERQLRLLVRALGWQPAGWRHTGRGGHPCAVYDWARICELHAALAPFLHSSAGSG